LSSPDFYWMTGFECSAFPHIGADELAETQHYLWWASDIERLRDTGITMIRYGIPWHRVNPRPHEYDWTWTDGALDLLQQVGITPIVDMYHYGTPLWIEGGIMNPIFGEMQGWYAKAFAQRYPQITYYTPTNEPYICAAFGTEFAIWYPFLRGQKNAVRSFKNVAEGICRSMRAIRAIRPDAMLMIPDTCEYYHSVEGAFPEEAAWRVERRFLVHDLYQGLVTRDHPLWTYMVENGVAEWELEWFWRNPARLDLLGLDYYKHSEHQLRQGPNGERFDETAEHQLGFAELARQYSTRYNGVPVILAETNVGGPVEERIAWADTLVGEMRRAREAGTPVGAFTYYGAIDHVDWDTALRERNLNINPCGMWALSWQGDKLIRTPTALVDWYRAHIALPISEAVGTVGDPTAAERLQAVFAPVASH
jgi:beta-glucosidase